MHLPAGFLAGFRQGVEKHLPILLGPGNGFSTISTIHDVIDRPGILDSESSRHAAEFAPEKATGQ
jgi:hypothetical protein